MNVEGLSDIDRQKPYFLPPLIDPRGIPQRTELAVHIPLRAVFLRAAFT